eukprot:7391360-Prymnesium_polylepis.2
MVAFQTAFNERETRCLHVDGPMSVATEHGSLEADVAAVNREGPLARGGIQAPTDAAFLQGSAALWFDDAVDEL